MSRITRAISSLVFAPPTLGAAYLLALTALASRAPIVEEGDRALGAQAREVSTFVTTAFAPEIQRVALAIVAAALAVGFVLGALGGLVVRARRALAAQPRIHGLRFGLEALAVTAAMHALLVLRAMATSPQLYADTWYARGGLRRSVQVLATDVLGVRGVTVLAVLFLALYLAGPRRAWPLWPRRMRRLVSVVRALPAGATAAVAALAFLVLALPRAGERSAHADAAAPAGAPMNVIVLAADSFRADRLTPAVAPHLSALANHGTRFDRAYVSLPRTFPSWVTLLTGRHPHHHGVRSMFARWEDRDHPFDAVPSRLRARGYRTAVVSDYAGDIFGRVDLGFDRVDTPDFDFLVLLRQRALERQTPLLPVLHSRVGRRFFPTLREMNQAADPAMLEADAATALRDLAGSGQPFFLTVFFSTAHFPYAAPAPYYAKYTDPKYRGRFKYHKPVGLGRDADPTPEDVQQIRALFDGAVTSIDDAADALLAELDRLGLRERTIVVVTADHGETLFDNGHGQGHGDHLFGDEGTHVPFVVVDPRKPVPAGGRRDDRIVRDVDLAATLYDLTGTPPPADLDGVSVAPALAGGATPKTFAYAETELWMGDVLGLPDELRLPYPTLAHLTEIDVAHGHELVLQKELEDVTTVARHRMIRDDRWKLVYVPTREGPRYLLFDTVTDPGEVTDVASTHPAEVERLRGELWRWMLSDARMVERGGFLVPRTHAQSAPATAALRIPGSPSGSPK
jgi:arylsulfatase A-like enzyme